MTRFAIAVALLLGPAGLSAQTEQWETLGLIPAPPIPGMVPWPSGGSLSAGPNSTLFTLRTSDSPDVRELWRFSLFSGQWTLVAKPPWWAYDGRLVWDGQDSLFSIGDDFLTPGIDATGLMTYSALHDTWGSVSPVAAPGTFLYGPVVWGGNDHVYVSGSWMHTWYFRRYTVSTGTWTSMATPTYLVREHAAMACPGNGDLIFMIQEDDEWELAPSNRFQVYSQSLNQWNPASAGGDPPDCPAAIGAGAALCCPPPFDRIWAFPGGGVGFWIYDIAARTWSRKPDAPAAVGLNSGLAWPGSGHTLYAVRGDHTAEFWRYFMTDHPPAVPATPKQYAIDGHELAVGDMTKTKSVTVRATVADAEGGLVRLAVEFKPLGVSFSGAGIVGDPVPAGTVASVTITNLSYGQDYHWQVWTIDDGDQASPPLSFGGNGEDSADVRIQAETAPTLGALQVKRVSDGATITWGSTIYDTTGLEFSAPADDAEDDAIALEIEWKPLGTALTGNASASGSMVPDGGPVSVVATLPAGPVHLQARIYDARGAIGPWISCGGNADSATDLKIIAGGSSGSIHCSPFSAAGRAGAIAVLAALLLLRRRI